MTNRKQLGIPYHTQHNNDQDHDSGPWNECSYTAYAMCGSHLGIKGNGHGQLEDQFEKSFEAMGLTRGAPEHMSFWFNKKYNSYGFQSKFTYTGSWADIVKAIDNGNPLVIHTDLTRSGHVIACDGYDLDAYYGDGAIIAQDPWGEWFSSGYNTNITGHDVKYSRALCNAKMGPDGNYWLHEFSRI